MYVKRLSSIITDSDISISSNNTFQIEVNSNNLKLDGFEIIHQDENNFTVKIPSDKNSKELITEILKTSEIISFNEKIPSMEEIFIKTVSNG